MGVYQAIGLAAGACTGEGVILDISDPVHPKVVSNVEDPNLAFWHSATISNDGKRVLLTDELGGGGQATCNPTVGPNRGADAIYDITDPANPRFLSYFKIPRTQSNTETCVAHEIAWFDRGPIAEDHLELGGNWSTYCYNGRIFGSEIYRGFDVYKLHGIKGSGQFKAGTLNAQTQAPLGG
jgi:hypothetical protein